MALWCAFVLTSPRGVHYHVGDTGFGDGALFSDVRARFGPPRLATLPIGAYEPRWFMQAQHVDPAEAVKAFTLLGAEQALGHHWGTFHLTDEGIERPVEALAAALGGAGIPAERFVALRPGRSGRPDPRCLRAVFGLSLGSGGRRRRALGTMRASFCMQHGEEAGAAPSRA